MSESLERERAHQDTWYSRAVEERFFEREGFRRLISWNLARLRATIPFTSGARVLSLGCGTGEYERLLAPSVGHVLGLDLSSVAIADATRRARDAGLTNITFIREPLHEAAFPPASFDVVFALGLLHHLDIAEREALLSRVRTWLSPGGWFYARDPNANGLLRRAFAWRYRSSEFHSPNEAALEPASLCEELRRAGFGEPVIGFTDVLAGPLPWLLRTPAAPVWQIVFGFDRLWLATPGLRTLASQFDIRAQA